MTFRFLLVAGLDTIRMSDHIRGFLTSAKNACARADSDGFRNTGGWSSVMEKLSGVKPANVLPNNRFADLIGSTNEDEMGTAQNKFVTVFVPLV